MNQRRNVISNSFHFKSLNQRKVGLNYPPLRYLYGIKMNRVVLKKCQTNIKAPTTFIANNFSR